MEINTKDLFVEDEETLGGLEDEFGPSVAILLKSFDLNSSLLKLSHLEVLRDRVAPFLAGGKAGFAEIYAMTDRSGSRGVNYQVSGERLLSVQRNLMSIGVPIGQVFHPFAKALGEDFFEFKNKQSGGGNTTFRDSLKEADFRSVFIGLSPAPLGIPTRNFRRSGISDVVRFGRVHVKQPG